MRLRSARLEALLGAPLEQVTELQLQGLIDGQVEEDADLDFKIKPYDTNDNGKDNLASDVAAMANSRGGLIIIGIGENAHSQAGSLAPAPLRSDEAARIQQILAARVAPLPETDVRTISSEDDPTLGWTLIATAASARAPLAVRSGSALRYSIRVGSTTRHLSEPEVAAAYRDRDRRQQQRVDRILQVQHVGEQRLHRRADPWLVLTAVPELAGRFPITTDSFAAMKAALAGHDIGSVLPLNGALFRIGVGKRRIWASGELQDTESSTLAQYEFFDDGSSSLAAIVPSMKRDDSDTARRILTINDAGIVRGLVNAVHRAAEHAARSDAGGELLLTARLLVPQQIDDLVVAHWDGNFSHPRGSVKGIPEDLEADVVAPIDGLLQPTGFLFAVAAALGDQLAQGIGLAELGYVGQDGSLIGGAWSSGDLTRLRPFAAPVDLAAT